MRAVIQRVSEASVSVSGVVCGQINQGLMVLIGVEESDDQEDVSWLTQKIAGLRIFTDAEGKMNESVQDIKGEVLVVSQFTLHASTKKGTRPSFIRAARPEHAIPLYETFVAAMSERLGSPVATGEFGADMQVRLTNDGPVTIWIDTKNKS
ncbi:D-aminoacyl-tRNA deacylase [Flavobacteriales bacterium]|nr:D-aminoacyl-tRNA deacylase [Flavobacteriales bacterium]